jgi:Family of unknown function (DUF6338)
VIPSTLTGVLAFLASVGPGYVYVRIAEQWRPYVQRTPLREAAEIVVSGSLATLVAVVVALIFGNLTGFLDLHELAVHPGHYLVESPENAGLALLIVALVSYGLAWALATNAPGKGSRVFPDSGWYAAFERKRPRDHAIVATAELRDGRKLTGLVKAFTAEQMPVDERELTLERTSVSRMLVLMPGSELPQELDEDFIVLRGSEIVYVAATFVPRGDPPAPAARPKGGHWTI